MMQNEVPSEIFARNLRRLIKERDISYAELERATGIARSTLNETANGKHMVSLNYAIKIAHYFGLTVEEMVDHVSDKGNREKAL